MWTIKIKMNTLIIANDVKNGGGFTQKNNIIILKLLQ